MKSGDSVLVQVTKDPIGHKGARLTAQVSLPGRYLVYVPDGSMTGISRKLPDTERSRLKAILKKIVPDDAGVIVRTAAEGASEEELTRDVTRLQAQWEAITKQTGSATAPALLHEEPDLTVRVIRDVFNEDFSKLVVSGDDAWDTVEDYVKNVLPTWLSGSRSGPAPTTSSRPTASTNSWLKALDRKVWLPSRRLPDHRQHRGDGGRRRQHRQVHRIGRKPRADGHQEQHRGGRGDRAPAEACATSAASSSSTSSTWCSRATASSCSVVSSSAWDGTAPSTRWPRSPRSASSR